MGCPMPRVLSAHLLCLVLAAPSVAEESGEARRLDPAVLALCRSIDPAARLYCLRAVAAQGDPGGEAKQTIAEMAEQDVALREQAAETYARLYGSLPATHAPESALPAAPRGERRPAAPDPAKASGDPMRVIVAPTAFTRPEGTTSFNAFELGTLTFDHGLTPNVAVGVQTAIPIGALILGPTLRVGFPFDGGAIGFHLNALVFAPFVGNSNTYLVAGGGPVLTLGNYDRYLNLGVVTYFVSSNGDGVVVPHAGFSVRAAPKVRFGVETYLPGAFGKDARDAGFGKLGIVLWGVRLFGESLWGDIALVDPICDGCGSLYRALPLGIPFLNIGLGW